MPTKQIKDFTAVSSAALADLILTQQNADDVTRKYTLTQILNLFASSYMQTVMDDANAAAARATLEAAALAANTLTGIQTLSSTQLRQAKGADVASANALTLGTDGNYFDITGTTSITSIGTLGVGTIVTLHFDAALTLTHHATDLILPGGANITTAAGDEFTFIEYATGDWRCIGYVLASGAAIATELSNDASPQLGGALDGQNNAMTNIASIEIDDAAGATPTAKTLYEDSFSKAWVYWTDVAGTPTIQDDINVSSITDNGVGNYTINFATAFSANTSYSAAGMADINQILGQSSHTTTSFTVDHSNDAGTATDGLGNITFTGNN